MSWLHLQAAPDFLFWRNLAEEGSVISPGYTAYSTLCKSLLPPLSGLDPILGEHLSGSPIAFAVFVQSLSRLDQFDRAAQGPLLLP